jgi:hypothetical protein
MECRSQAVHGLRFRHRERHVTKHVEACPCNLTWVRPGWALSSDPDVWIEGRQQAQGIGEVERSHRVIQMARFHEVRELPVRRQDPAVVLQAGGDGQGEGIA